MDDNTLTCGMHMYGWQNLLLIRIERIINFTFLYINMLFVKINKRCAK